MLPKWTQLCSGDKCNNDISSKGASDGVLTYGIEKEKAQGKYSELSIAHA